MPRLEFQLQTPDRPRIIFIKLKYTILPASIPTGSLAAVGIICQNVRHIMSVDLKVVNELPLRRVRLSLSMDLPRDGRDFPLLLYSTRNTVNPNKTKFIYPSPLDAIRSTSRAHFLLRF